MSTTQARLSVFDTHSMTTARQFITPHELVQMVENPTIGAKTAAKLITPYESQHKTLEAALKAPYAAIVVDHDNDNRSEQEIRGTYDIFGVPYLAFTTSSHMQQKGKEQPANRWKVIIPLAYAASADQVADISAGIAFALQSDPVQARKQQGFYAPNKLQADSPYIAITDRIGDSWEWLQIDDAESVFIIRAMDGLSRLQAKEEQEAVTAVPKPRQSMASHYGSIVELISQSYSLAGLFSQHGYKRKGKNLYLSPYSSTGVAGVRLLSGNGKEVVFSHHGASCPLSKDNHNGHALDVADVLCALEYRGDFAEMIRKEAARLDREGQKQRQREYRQQQSWESQEEWQQQPEGSEAPPHPLTVFADQGEALVPPDWVLPDLIAEGVVLFAGGHGVGKTTALLPLAMAAAGVHRKDYPLAPEHWRHVIYITEDVNQAKRIIAGYTHDLDWPAGSEMAERTRERVHLVEAHRSKPVYVAAVGHIYRDSFTRTVTTTGLDGETYTTELLPLVVIDTLAASLEIENENDNSEASAAIATLKQRFAGLPVWIVGHTAKANLNNPDAITARGAGAFEADAHQVLYLVKDNKSEKRWLKRGKTRHESPWQELEIISYSKTAATTNRFGSVEDVTLRWAVAMPSGVSRADRIEQDKAERAERDQEALRQRVIEVIGKAFDDGKRLNRSAVRAAIGGNTQAMINIIAALQAEGWLYEVEVPRAERLKNKASFLVVLTADEREAFQHDGTLPEHKLIIPPDWKKVAASEPKEIEPEGELAE